MEEFCFFSGCLDHVERDCQRPSENENNEENETNEEMVYQYGPYLRGSPKKRRKISASEREERQLMSKLKGKKVGRRPGYDDPRAVKLGPPSAARKLLFGTPKATFKKMIPGEKGLQLIEVATGEVETEKGHKLGGDSSVKMVRETVELGCSQFDVSGELEVCGKNDGGNEKRGCVNMEYNVVVEGLAGVNGSKSKVVDFVKEQANVGELPNINFINNPKNVLINVVHEAPGKSGVKWKRTARDGSLIKGASDVSASATTMAKRNFADVSANNDDVVMVDGEKKLKYDMSSKAGDGVNRVEGVGKGQSLEQQ